MTDEQAPIWLRPNVAAYAAKVEVRTLAAWARAGDIHRNPDGLYDLREIHAYMESWSPARQAKVSAGRCRRGETRRGRRVDESAPPVP